jgi:HSP20 family protein
MTRKPRTRKTMEKSIAVRTPAKIYDVTIPGPVGVKDEIERLFDDVRTEMEKRYINPWIPASAFITVKEPSVDIIDTGKEFVVHADMPGIPKENISINVTTSKLEIMGENRRQVDETEKDYITKERQYTQFYRATPLPSAVIPDKTQASVNNGVLEVHLPKKNPTDRKKHKVTVK